jgi:hypothetical protein
LGLVVEDDVSAEILHELKLLVRAGGPDNLEALLLGDLNHCPDHDISTLATVKRVPNTYAPTGPAPAVTKTTSPYAVSIKSVCDQIAIPLTSFAFENS